MKKNVEYLKKYSMSFWYLNLLILLLLCLPKVNFIMENLPIRVGLLFLFIVFVLIDYKSKKISFNNNKNILLSIVYILFLLCTIPSLFVTKSFITSLYTMVKFILFYSTFYLCMRINYSKEEKNILYKTFIFGVLIVCLIGLISYTFGLNLFTLSNNFYPGIKGRIRSTFFNPCYLAAFLVMIFPISLYKLSVSKETKYNIFYIIFSVIVYICLLFTFTRSAMLMFIVIVLISFYLFRKVIFNKKVLILFLIIITLTPIIPGSISFYKKTLDDGKLYIQNIASFIPGVGNSSSGNGNNFNDSSLEDRQSYSLWAKRFGNDHKLTGIGFGGYLKYLESDDLYIDYPDYDTNKVPPHSSLNLLYAETGVISLIMFTLFIIICCFKVLNCYIYSRNNDKKLYYVGSIGLLIGFAFLPIALMSENLMYDTQIFPLFLIMVAFVYNTIMEDISKNNKVLFISSTGGHLNELMQLNSLFDKYNSYLITEKTDSTISLKNKYKNVYYLVFGTKDHIFSYIFKFSFNVIKSFCLYLKIRPKVIITTGTHTAVPMCYIGKLFGSKIIFIETFANSKTKTLSGKIVYKIADTFIVQWEEMKKLYPKAICIGWIY